MIRYMLLVLEHPDVTDEMLQDTLFGSDVLVAIQKSLLDRHDLKFDWDKDGRGLMFMPEDPHINPEMHDIRFGNRGKPERIVDYWDRKVR